MYFVFSDRADALQGIIVRCCETSTESEASLDRDQVLHFSRILASDQGLSRNQNKNTFDFLFQQTLGFKRSSKTADNNYPRPKFKITKCKLSQFQPQRLEVETNPECIKSSEGSTSPPMGARANKLGAKYCAAAVSCNLEGNIGGSSTDQRRKVTLIRRKI